MVLAESTVKHLAELKNISLPRSNYLNGILSEVEVSLFYLKKGFCLRAHRLKTPFSEVDLLLENNSYYLMVEVKRTIHHDFDSLRIRHAQKRRLENAFLYLENILEKPLRMEYVVVSRSGEITAFDDFWS